MTGLVVAVALVRIAVDQRPREHRMGLAPHLVLDREQHLARIEIDDVLEAVFVFVELERDQSALQQPIVGAGEVLDVDLEVVAVVGLFRASVSRK